MSKKVKVWQTDVEGIDAWQNLIEDSNGYLLVLELYSDIFGYTEVLTIPIMDIMKAVGEKSKILWRRANVVKLEAEAQERAQEKQKNKDESSAKPVKATVPGLEKFSGFASPQPWILIMKCDKKNTTLYDILKAANPPELQAMVEKYMKEDVAPKEEIDFDINLRTNAEIEAAKNAKATERALVKEIESRIETTDPEDPNSLTVEEVQNIFKLFCDENGRFLPFEMMFEAKKKQRAEMQGENEAGAAEEDEEPEADPPISDIVDHFMGKGVTDIVAYMKQGVTLARLNEVEERKDEIRKEKAAAEAEELRKLAEEAKEEARAEAEAKAAEDDDEATVEQGTED